MISRGQTSSVATSLLNGRQALKLIHREPDGFILKTRIANAVQCTPQLLRVLIQRHGETQARHGDVRAQGIQSTTRGSGGGGSSSSTGGVGVLMRD